MNYKIIKYSNLPKNERYTTPNFKLLLSNIKPLLFGTETKPFGERFIPADSDKYVKRLKLRIKLNDTTNMKKIIEDYNYKNKPLLFIDWDETLFPSQLLSENSKEKGTPENVFTDNMENILYELYKFFRIESSDNEELFNNLFNTNFDDIINEVENLRKETSPTHDLLNKLVDEYGINIDLEKLNTPIDGLSIPILLNIYINVLNSFLDFCRKNFNVFIVTNMMVNYFEMYKINMPELNIDDIPVLYGSAFTMKKLNIYNYVMLKCDEKFNLCGVVPFKKMYKHIFTIGDSFGDHIEESRYNDCNFTIKESIQNETVYSYYSIVNGDKDDVYLHYNNIYECINNICKFRLRLTKKYRYIDDTFYDE